MRAYAQQAKDHEFVWWAAELKLDAERKAGRMLTAMGLVASRPPKASQRGTLSDYDITRNQSSRWQAVGAVTDEDYEAWKDSLNGESFPTSSGLRNFAKLQTAEQGNGPWRTDAVSEGRKKPHSLEASNLS